MSRFGEEEGKARVIGGSAFEFMGCCDSLRKVKVFWEIYGGEGKKEKGEEGDERAGMKSVSVKEGQGTKVFCGKRR